MYGCNTEGKQTLLWCQANGGSHKSHVTLKQVFTDYIVACQAHPALRFILVTASQTGVLIEDFVDLSNVWSNGRINVKTWFCVTWFKHDYDTRLMEWAINNIIFLTKSHKQSSQLFQQCFKQYSCQQVCRGQQRNQWLKHQSLIDWPNQPWLMWSVVFEPTCAFCTVGS